jgi:hypothetical protein
VSGAAGGALLQAIFIAVGHILVTIGDEIQRRRAEAEFNVYAPSIAAFLQEHPELGALIVFRFTQQVSNPSGEQSLIKPGWHFLSVEAFYGRTQIEAQMRRREAGEDRAPHPTGHVVPRYSLSWIPPLRAARKETKVREPHPSTAVALMREIKVDLKIRPPNYRRIFHHLNGSSMQQMLDALGELKQSDQLNLLIQNFDKAEGVNRGRIWVAIRVTVLRGKPDALKILMADDALELSGIEPEGRQVIERILRTNKGG